MPFPPGSIRAAVAQYGDIWAMAFEPDDDDAALTPNWWFRAERHDAAVMNRCSLTMDRGTAFDPRVWIGVPLTERQP
jgi:hypothetical protein